MNPNPSISLIRADSYELELLQNNIAKLLEPMGGMAAIVKKGDRVLLKPNLLTGARPGKECTTRPELVYVVAQMVIEAGGKPFLGDSPAFGSAKGVAAANGYLPWIEKLNLPIIDFHGQRYQTLGEEFNHLLLSTEAMEADVAINLPIVKVAYAANFNYGCKKFIWLRPWQDESVVAHGSRER